MNPCFRSVAWAFSAFCLQSAICFGGTPVEDLPFEERAKIFAAEREQAQAFLDGILQSEDVPRLELLADSAEETKKAIPPSSLGMSPDLSVQDVRIAAFVRLGELQTKESLAAIERIEKKAKECNLVPEVVSLELNSSPVFHFRDSELSPLATVKAPDGTTYGVINHPFLMGGDDFFLISSKKPDDESSWSRPKLILAEAPDTQYIGGEASLAVKGDGVLELTISSRKVVLTNLPPRWNNQAPAAPQEPWKTDIPIREVLEDQDGDGWTDVEELRLGLDPRKKDTDGDGLDDGKDPCPNFALPPDHEDNEEELILQKAFFAAFGLTDSRFLLLVRPPSTKVHIWGYTGPVIYLDEGDVDQWRKQHERGGMFVTWTIAPFSNETRVRFSDYESSMSGSSQEIILRKIDGNWIVIQRKKGGVA
jgi:hypothetical protein